MAKTVSILKDAVASLEWCELELVNNVGTKPLAVSVLRNEPEAGCPEACFLPNELGDAPRASCGFAKRTRLLALPLVF
jgi:hypothetical protein